MTILHILYSLTIKPLELFFEVVYVLADRIIGNPGISIIALSLAMNFLVLPLYRRADAMQDEERELEGKLSSGVQHIKKYFKGDERMMMLQTYYRQNNYKQSYVLRGSLPLLLEVPFFIAAYRFLSSLAALQGVSLGPIGNLGAPDGMLQFGGLAINVLPILMTLINIVSGAIYTKGMPVRTKVQLYGMALIFLVFLYDSPAGLVFYWTLNNVFSLVKNIFYKLKNPSRVLKALLVLIGVLAEIYLLGFYQTPSMLRKMVLVGAGVLLILVPVWNSMQMRRECGSGAMDRYVCKTGPVFFSAALYLSILTGILIPSAVIEDSPQEFVNELVFYDPVKYLGNSFLYAAGIFLVWCGLFFWMAGTKNRERMAKIAVYAAFLFTVDYMLFKPASRSGNLNTLMQYENGLEVDFRSVMLEVVIASLLIVLMRVLWGKRWKILCRFVPMMTVVIVIMSGLNVRSIHSSLTSVYQRVKSGNPTVSDDLTFSLSRTGKNVVVIMLDRALGPYIPYMLNEKPELEKQLAGFTYYPNTLSFGEHTNLGVPALLGGYEYTPVAMNERKDESLKDKHDEALLSIPVLCLNNGFKEITICDPPYAGYEWDANLDIYDNYPEISARIMAGRFSTSKVQEQDMKIQVRNRNFFCYSVMRCMPLVLQKALYNEGQFNAASGTGDEYTPYSSYSPHRAKGFKDIFDDAFTVLQNLKDITVVTDKCENTYLFMDNDTVHNCRLLQEPEYLPEDEIDNTEYDKAHQDRFEVNGAKMQTTETNQLEHYQSMMAAFIQLGNWFDYLRENGVYDNTRIILVSDHARRLGQFSDRVMEDGTDTMAYNPLLMVKDFNSNTFTTSEEFMTNADVPYLSMEGLVDDLSNPFTGKQITNKGQKEGKQYVLDSDFFNVDDNHGIQFKPGDWYAVQKDVRVVSNWSKVSENSVLP